MKIHVDLTLKDVDDYVETDDAMTSLRTMVSSAPSNMVVCSFYNTIVGADTADAYRLCVRDARILLSSDAWFNDEIMNAYIALLRRNAHGKRDRNLDFVYAEDTYRHVSNYGRMSKSRKSHEARILSCVSLLPLHINKCHWVLLIFDKNGKATYYDPSRASVNVPAQIFEFARSYMRFRSYPETSVHVLLRAPRQDNTYDCGLFVLRMMKHVCREVDDWRIKLPCARFTSMKRSDVLRELIYAKIDE